jgi:hypothetical protein
MVEARFYIGKDEKHELHISYSYWTTHLKVDIDGRRVTDGWIPWLSKTLTYTVGDKEVHEVIVKIHKFLGPHIEVYVDGKLHGKI